VLTLRTELHIIEEELCKGLIAAVHFAHQVSGAGSEKAFMKRGPDQKDLNTQTGKKKNWASLPSRLNSCSRTGGERVGRSDLVRAGA